MTKLYQRAGIQVRGLTAGVELLLEQMLDKPGWNGIFFTYLLYEFGTISRIIRYFVLFALRRGVFCARQGPSKTTFILNPQ